ncbi:MAG TPA: hypothetical protein VGI99_11090, partial [Gemmataceae bacterium]
MRRKLILGLGLTGLFAGSAPAQFGAPAQPPSSPTPFGGTVVGAPAPGPIQPMPMVPAVRAMGSYVAPVGGFQPAR